MYLVQVNNKRTKQNKTIWLFLAYRRDYSSHISSDLWLPFCYQFKLVSQPLFLPGVHIYSA